MPLHCAGVRSHLRVKKCLSNAPDWSPSMLSPESCCFPISQQQQSCHIGKQEDSDGDEVGSLSFRGKKSLSLAWIGLL